MINKTFLVSGKVAIVTGAGRGIGKAISLVLAEAGATVVIIARNEQEIREVAEQIRDLGGQSLCISIDVSQEKQISSAVDQIISQFGSIDILVNNAGITNRQNVIALPKVNRSIWPGIENESLTVDQWWKVFDVNLGSVFLFSKEVGPQMIKQGKGKIINISSTNADEGIAGTSAYSTSKAGISTFTRCLASEWGQFNINVNAVAPGMIVTELTSEHFTDQRKKRSFLNRIPLGRLGKPKDVALLVLFLSSEASDYITGQIVTVDGGAMGHGVGI
ncbi:SDR family NAD(P)-dependent oxidoreductase [Chloroflexota bacterium]